MQTYFEGEQASLFAPDTFAGRMFQAASAQARRTGRISGLSWRKLLDYIAPDYQFLDLSSDAGNLLGQYEWTIRSALHGECWLRNYAKLHIIPLSRRLDKYPRRVGLGKISRAGQFCCHPVCGVHYAKLKRSFVNRGKDRRE